MLAGSVASAAHVLDKKLLDNLLKVIFTVHFLDALLIASYIALKSKLTSIIKKFEIKKK